MSAVQPPSAVRIGLDLGSHQTTVLVQLPHGGLGVERLPAAGAADLSARCQAALGAALRLLTGGEAGEPPELEVTYASAATTRALLQGPPPRVVLLTTDGFTDVLRISRQTAPPLRAAPALDEGGTAGAVALPGASEGASVASAGLPAHCLPVPERVAADGTVVQPLTAGALAALREQVGGLAAQAVAVMLLHSPQAPGHEQQVAQELGELGLPLTVSSEVLPGADEFARAAAAVLAAAGAVAQTAEAAALHAALPRPGRVRRVQGDGAARREPPPLRGLLSDVAAGLVGAHKAAVALETARCLSLGVGESVSVAAHHDGVLALTSRAQLAGLPLGVPTLAAALRPVGGESRFHLSSDARWVHADTEPAGRSVGPNDDRSVGPNDDRNVGPNDGRNAGRNGGLDVSLADAARVTGRAVGPAASAAGLSEAQRRLAALGQRLQVTAEAAAAALLAAATTQLVDAVWAVSVERGQDPADFPLLAYGPGGGLFAAAVAEQLGMRSVVIPPAADLLTAYGALSAPVLRERSRLLRCEASGAQQRGLLEATLRSLTDELRRDLAAEGRLERGHPMGLQWSADLRYAGQAHTLTLAGLGEGGPAPDGTTDLVVRFHQEHERRYGFTLGERPVELEQVRVRAAAPIIGPSFVQLCQRAREEALRAAAACPGVPGGVVLYGALTAAVAGPVVIAEPSVSTFVPVGWTAELDKQGAIWLRRAA